MYKKNETGFTLIELVIVVVIIGVLVSIFLPAYKDYKMAAKLRNPPQICKYTKSDFSDFVGGISVGSVVTAGLAQDSFVLIITEAGVMYGGAAAVAPAITLTAGTVAAGYIALKAYCSSDNPQKWHGFAVEQASKTFKIIHDGAKNIRVVVIGE